MKELTEGAMGVALGGVIFLRMLSKIRVVE